MQELVIDDSLPIMDRIKKYIHSDIMLHRLYLVRSLGDSARQIGFQEAQTHLIPLLEDLMPDPEASLRQALVEQIPDISKYFVELNLEDAYTIVLHTLIPMVAELTTDRHLQVLLYLFYLRLRSGEIICNRCFDATCIPDSAR
jgi:hypothetical protein